MFPALNLPIINFRRKYCTPTARLLFSYSPSPASSSSSKSKETVLSKPPEKILTPQLLSHPRLFPRKILPLRRPKRSEPRPKRRGRKKNLASVITIGEKNNSSAKIWLILAVFTGIIGGVGVFLARRNNQISKN